MVCELLVLLAAVLSVLGGLGVLLWLGVGEVLRHLRQDPAAARAVVEHLIIPLLARKEPKPEVTEVKGTTV